nr:DUF2157 domain-containing protein [Psychrobacter sp. PraFG1]UNK05419.1 DUF2157 domain-containing protein [Psychrobacter sp. PraFG1]
MAYNWTAMGKMGKFALVQSALIVSVLGYVAFAYKRSTVSAQHKTYLIEPLLLLIASVVVGSLLALFGQIYQTGADSWQLFLLGVADYALGNYRAAASFMAIVAATD